MSVPPSSEPMSTTTTTGTMTTIGKGEPKTQSESNPAFTSIPSNQSTELQFQTESPAQSQEPANTQGGARAKETDGGTQIVADKQIKSEHREEGNSNLNSLPMTATTATTVVCRTEQASGSVNQQHSDQVHHYNSNGSNQNERDEGNDNQEALSNEEQPSVAASEPSVEENSAGLGDVREVSESKDAGRKKIKIELIRDPRSRQVTFLKRKNGLMKKAMELVSLVFLSPGHLPLRTKRQLITEVCSNLNSFMSNCISFLYTECSVQLRSWSYCV